MKPVCFGVVFPALLVLFIAAPFVPSAISPDYIRSVAVGGAPGPPLADSYDGLLWWVQVSDIHLSNTKLDRIQRFATLVEATLPALRPKMVLMTGDITDANKPANMMYRGQNKDEWDMYRSALRGVPAGNIPWLDVRGNHDAFNVPWFGSDGDYFSTYRRHAAPGGHYSQVVDTGFGRYRFVCIDSVVRPAPTRHFFGELSTPAVDELVEVLHQDDGPFNLTIAFGHYPSNTIVTTHTHDANDGTMAGQHTLPEMLDGHGVVAYLSGHLHKFLGPGNTLYARPPRGPLELELGDFKYTSRFRVLAADGDVVSFVDTHLNQWPVVLVTNPKDATFLSEHEALARMATSTHVRVLVFPEAGDRVVSVTVSVDGGPPVGCKQAAPGGQFEQGADVWTGSDGQPPLWTAPWPTPPADLEAGLHTISVVANTAAGSSHTHSHKFSVDGTVADMHWFGQWFMNTHFRAVFKFVGLTASFIVAVVMLWIPMVRAQRMGQDSEGQDAVLEWVDAHIVNGAEPGTSTMHRFFDCLMLPYLCLYATRPRLHKALLFFVLYFLLGPWFFGPVFNNHMGTVTLWCIWAPGHPLLPHYDGFIYLVFVMVLGHGPLVHLLASCAVEARLVKLQQARSSALWLMQAAMLFLVTAEASVMVLPNVVFHGLAITLASPTVLWYSSAALYFGWSTALRTWYGFCQRGVADGAAKAE